MRFFIIVQISQLLLKTFTINFIFNSHVDLIYTEVRRSTVRCVPFTRETVYETHGTVDNIK